MKIHIAIISYLAAFAICVCGETNDAVVHGQPAFSIQDKLENMVLPTAPFLTDRIDEQDVVYRFKWFEKMSRAGEPEGEGVTFRLDFSEHVELTKTDPMAHWLDSETPMDELPSPQIHRIRMIDYLKYLVSARNLDYVIEDDEIIVFRKEISQPGKKGSVENGTKLRPFSMNKRSRNHPALRAPLL